MAIRYIKRLLPAIVILSVANVAGAKEDGLERIAGTYTTVAGNYLTIDKKGQLSGSLNTSGCTISGHLMLLESRDVYTLTATFAGCSLAPVDVTQWAPEANDLSPNALNGAPVTGTAVLDAAVAPHQLQLWMLIRTTNLQFAANLLTTCYSPMGPGKCY